eukprot:1162071-Pelagomonas_calceolata.AAC.5
MVPTRPFQPPQMLPQILFTPEHAYFNHLHIQDKLQALAHVLAAQVPFSSIPLGFKDSFVRDQTELRHSRPPTQDPHKV